MPKSPPLLPFGCLLCVVLLSGCTLGPRQIRKGRLEYNEAVQESFREEMLLNLVRMRYRETPEFLSVGGIAAQYTFDGRASSNIDLPDGGAKKGFLGGGVSRTERPTISYVPARGEAFQKGLLAPIDLQTVQLLARTGWSWERIMRTTVQYMNQIDNATSAGGPTPKLKPQYEEFRYLAKLMRELQQQRAIELASATRPGSPKLVPLNWDQIDGDFVSNAIQEGYTINDTEDGITLVKDETYLALITHPQTKLSGSLEELAEILNLSVDYQSPKPAVFEVHSSEHGWIQSTYSDATVFEAHMDDTCIDDVSILPAPTTIETRSPRRNDIVVSTRSLLEVMFFLSQGVTVPTAHEQCGLVTVTVDEEGNPFDWSEMMHDLFTVKVCDHCPDHAAVSIKYRGHWFYIDERDQTSLSTYTLLVELFGIEVRAGGGGGFLYTLGI